MNCSIDNEPCLIVSILGNGLVKRSAGDTWHRRSTASRFKEIGPMAMGPNTIHGDLRGKQMG